MRREGTNLNLIIQFTIVVFDEPGSVHSSFEQLAVTTQTQNGFFIFDATKFLSFSLQVTHSYTRTATRFCVFISHVPKAELIYFPGASNEIKFRTVRTQFFLLPNLAYPLLS